MSAEYETSRNIARRKDIMEKTMKTDSSNDDDDTLEELAGSANNSIIGKVKSRVSSIIPSSFSKWFSPSTRNNDSLNGSEGTIRRRRRLEIEDDEYVDDCDPNEDGSHEDSEYKENMSSHSDNVNKDSDEDDSDNNSEDDSPKKSIVSTQRTQRTIKSSGFVNQPPNKRSRISFDVTSDIHPPLIASTPAIESSRRNIYSSSLAEDTIPKPSTSHHLNYFTEAKAYNQKNLEQSSYAYVPAPAMDVKSQEDFANRPNTNEIQLGKSSAISSRRTLHLPSTSQSAKEQVLSMDFSSFKRQTPIGIRDVKTSNSETTEINTSTNIIEEEGTYGRTEVEARIFPDELVQANVKPSHNLNGNTSLLSGSKKPKLNGADEAEVGNADVDSASESSEGCLGNMCELPNNLAMGQRKTGLFNMSNLNCQNGKKSRTPSFGNGINFYSHLEGRKSLFSGGTNIGDSANVLNNSTLSLTSLNRRQFNASIYGSTSALSDSRLLNTFSPFYKGKTTYGGAAAYKKYSVGLGASRICSLTPTIIRPTSSLSTLSSSNNSITANAGGTNAPGGIGNNGIENTSAISSTAKRILDLINDFATPLSEAKKMANTTVKCNTQLLSQAKSRLNETDLQTSRAIRLSQVRTPYSRPAVTLQPTCRNANLQPPVRELQVPSMSQLLQMKKMQSTTERSRQITRQNSGSTTHTIVGGGEYSLPVANENNDVSQARQQQHPHTNKIKSKVRTSARISAANPGVDESPPPINLPNIAFPLMQSVPKFDIDLPKPKTVTPAVTSKPDFSTLGNMANAKVTSVGIPVIGSGSSSTILSNKTTVTFSTDSNKIAPTEQSKYAADINSNGRDKKAVATETNLNFKFSAPITFACVNDNASTQQNSLAVSKNYRFSPPTVVCSGDFGRDPASPTQRKVQSGDSVAPQLKRGSVLDALKEPFAMSKTPKEKTTNAGSAEVSTGFGDQFKKATCNKWECETCLIRNESNIEKCVACETPRIKSTSTLASAGSALIAPLATGSSGFGSQFKKSSNQWECDVCMVRNSQQSDKCIACETPRKGATAPTTLAGSNRLANSFGDAFKQKANTWECPTCLINNKSDFNECVACQTKNPNRTIGDSSVCTKAIANSTTYKFGFSTVDNTPLALPNAQPDIGFKSMAAAQMSAKWECDACMTRNDTVRNKCVCCEQAKPGTTTPDVPSNGPKFTFGSAASTKFTFGFGSSANEAPTTDSGVVTTSVAAFNQKTERGNSKDFVFGSLTPVVPSTSGGNSFSFGIKPTSVSTEKGVTGKGKGGESKDVTDNGNLSTQETSEAKKSAFKFGSTTTSASKDLVATDTALNFKFGVPPTAGTATVTATAEPTVKFSLTTPVAIDKDGSTKPSEPAPVTSSGQTSTGGFAFGNAASQQTSTSGDSFGARAESTSSETKTTTKTTFSFGAPPSTQPSQASTISAATSTATVKPMFSFGSNTTTTSAAAASTSAPALASVSSTTSSTTASAFTSSAGGFSFGSSMTGNAFASPSAKPIFGNHATSTTVSVAPSAVASVPATTMPTFSATPSNVFGAFGVSTASAKITPTSATPTLASTATMPAANASPFGTISQGVTPSGSGESKPTASATMIFGSASSKSAATAQVTSAPFVFGSSTSNVTTQGNASSAATGGNMVAPATSWTKGGFAFGASNGSAAASITNEAPKPVFGSFVAAVAPAASASAAPSTMGPAGSVFGSVGAISTTSGGNATFGSVAANTSAMSPATMFGAGNSAPASATQPTQNLFGSVSAAPSAFAAPSSFGSSSSNAVNSTPTFGSFGAVATNTSSDGGSAPKKSEPAFNFGGSSAQIASSGGFNFGTQASTAPKPAFNFTASSAPTFNFSGSISDAAKPFQFGATPSAPVFNLCGGATEATPNAPFQFNAGAPPASSNIFAPTPSASNAPGAMQARRKIRQPTRRLTPR